MTGRTQGFALSSRYAPIPRSILSLEGSARKAAIKLKRGSFGAGGTVSAGKLVVNRFDICALIDSNLVVDFRKSVDDCHGDGEWGVFIWDIFPSVKVSRGLI